MKLLVVFGLLSLLVTKSWSFVSREICFGELGCFGNSGAFYHVLWRPVVLLPDGPESIGTTFHLYTRQNLLLSEILEVDVSATNLTTTSFNAELETKVLVHGFRETEEDWMIDLKDAFLARDSLNIITVDWNRGAGIPYTQAASNTRVVGAQLALLIARLQNQTGLDLNKVHLIGFSLGAHVCGYAGERLDKVRRITGLDPAGPMFEDLLPVVSLDPTDAQFVDAIHTDGRSLLQLAFGSVSPVGHVDFYPNGGLKQPGCPENALETVSYATLGALLRGLDQAGEEVICRHGRARDLFLETVRDEGGCVPVGYPCPDWESFLAGLCTSCGPDGKGCGVMGLKAEEFKSNTSNTESKPKLYLKTAGARPFCLSHYSVRVQIPSAVEAESGGGFLSNVPLVSTSVGSNYGTLEISLAGDHGTSAHGELGQGNQVFEAGTEYPFLFVSEQDLGQIQSLVLKWQPASGTAGLVRLKFSVSDALPVGSVSIQPMQGNNSPDIFTFNTPQRSGATVTSERGVLMTRVEQH